MGSVVSPTCFVIGFEDSCYAQTIGQDRLPGWGQSKMATMLNVLKESIKDTGVKSFRTAITQRQVYVKSILDGDSVFESSDGAAKGQIEILTK